MCIVLKIDKQLIASLTDLIENISECMVKFTDVTI